MSVEHFSINDGTDERENLQPRTDDRIVPTFGGQVTPTLPSSAYHREVVSEQRWLQPSAWKIIVKRLFVEVFFNALLDKGATLSFFTLLTGLPTLLAFYAITTLVLDRNRDQVNLLTDEFIADNVPANFQHNAHTIVQTVIGSTEQSIIMLVVSIVFALFSSSAYIRAFSRMSNEMYGRKEGRGIIRTWVTMMAITLVLVLGLVFIAGAYFLREDIARPLLDKVAEPLNWQGFTTFVLDHFLPTWQYLRWPVILTLSLLLIAILYHVAPNVRFGRVRWVSVGSVCALISILAVGQILRLYLNNFGHFGLYGALGGVIVALVGLVVSNSLLLLGVKLDAEIARVRELQAGIESEHIIHVPPRSSSAVDGLTQLHQQLEIQAIELRAHSEPAPHSTASPPDDIELHAHSEPQSAAQRATRKDSPR
ncbi:YihY/virulence factor BrkB family protein [Corynebacterium anserum]|uniref:YihY/virulence factor BrkB family protein n=1 Tax=Corynebacterium anserum TaxID=2684406 RepID=A0A7G7YNZ6_9CORY|nr:YihY/virulence factor BrkB family protein [Corynebacterium anserum]MBC2681817.1 YihY/virulence factor BrkB family protein [Corynebacterium anserum]QNH96216.1 YihY/virulence factor BrkB family protein [Corynebacterium anserum]